MLPTPSHLHTRTHARISRHRLCQQRALGCCSNPLPTRRRRRRAARALPPAVSPRIGASANVDTNVEGADAAQRQNTTVLVQVRCWETAAGGSPGLACML